MNDISILYNLRLWIIYSLSTWLYIQPTIVSYNQQNLFSFQISENVMLRLNKQKTGKSDNEGLIFFLVF